MKKCWMTPWRIYMGAALLCVGAHLHSNAEELLLRDLATHSCIDFSDPSTQEIVVKVEAGTRLPLKFDIHGPLFSIEEGSTSATILVHQTLFIKIVPGACVAECSYCDGAQPEETLPELFFSTDQLTWMDFEEFFGGNLNAALVTDELTSEPVAQISLDVHLKQ